MSDTATSVEPAGQTAAPKRGTNWRRLGVILLVFVMLLVVMRQTAILESINFYHPRSTVPRQVPGVEEVIIPTPDGRTLHAWWMPPKGQPSGMRVPAVLHCHGNMGDIGNHASTAAYLPSFGVGVLLFDYRGFGKSTPQRIITRDELIIDARAALAVLKARPDVDPERIGAFGYSLGGTVALQLAAEDPSIRCVVSVATFSSWQGVAGDVIPVVGQLLIKSGMDAESTVTALGARPVMLIHGDKDDIVNIRHAHRIADAATQAHVPVDLAIVQGKGHFGLFEGDMKSRIGAFYTKNLPPRP